MFLIKFSPPIPQRTSQTPMTQWTLKTLSNLPSKTPTVSATFSTKAMTMNIRKNIFKSYLCL